MILQYYVLSNKNTQTNTQKSRIVITYSNNNNVKFLKKATFTDGNITVLF